MVTTRKQFLKRISKAFNILTITSILALTGCPDTVNNPADKATIQRVFSPTWGANSTKLAFLYKFRAENSQDVKETIYTALPDGQEILPIVELNPARFDRLFWSPNGQHFALTTEDSEEIFLVKSTGEELKKIGEGTSPSWDNTGTKIAYTHDNNCEFPDRVGGRQCSREIRLYDVTSESTTSLPLKLEQEVFSPTWSVDGSKLQWLTINTIQNKELSQRTLQFNTFVLAAQQHVATTIDPIEITFSQGFWSLDRNLLAFNYLSKINLFDFNKKENIEITNGIEPQISVDNLRILFTKVREQNRSDIMLLDRRTNTERVLISHQSLPLK